MNEDPNQGEESVIVSATPTFFRFRMARQKQNHVISRGAKEGPRSANARERERT